MENIIGFIHIGNLGRGKEIFFDQMDLIKSSGLYSKTKCIKIGVAGEALDFSFIDPKITIVSHDAVLTNGECLLLKTMHEYCQTCEPVKIWYIHTKGARFYNSNMPVYYHENGWRDYMQYFVIKKHEDCIEALNKFDVCGTEWVEIANCNIFAGNFWWANSNYIKKIKNPMTRNLFGDIRSRAEFDFIGKGNPKVKSFHTHGRLMYDHQIPKSSYMKNEIKLI